jgi:lysophospholipase L1-like esterase
LLVGWIALKKFLFGMVTFIFVVLLSLVSAEVILRFTWTPPLTLYDYSHTFIRREFRSGVDLLYHGDAVTGFDGDFRLKTGPVGYRTKSVLSREKSHEAYRIIFMGGSTTACTYIPQEMTFSQLVEDNLNGQGLPKRIECANAGVDGSAARDTLMQLIFDVSYANPDCVVVMQGVNDLPLGLSPSFQPDASTRRMGMAKAKSMYEEYFGDPHPYFYRFYKALTRRNARRFTLAHIRDVRERLSHLERIEITEFPNVSYFVRDMRLIASTCQALGIRLIFVTQCSLYADHLPPEVEQRLGIPFPDEDGMNPSNSSMKKGMEVYNDAVRNLAAEMGVELIDLEKAVPKTLDYLYDHVHFSVNGSKKVAEVLSGYLLETFPGPTKE